MQRHYKKRFWLVALVAIDKKPELDFFESMVSCNLTRHQILTIDKKGVKIGLRLFSDKRFRYGFVTIDKKFKEEFFWRGKI